MKRLNAALAAAFALLLAACAPSLPYRIALPSPLPDCRPDDSGNVAAECGSSMREHNDQYDLLFVEFDDQGLLYPPQAAGTGRASEQIALALRQLRDIAADTAAGYDGVSLFVFVHGWKHNAAADDSNVRLFRKMLLDAALVESVAQKRHHVVGVYVSWRGASVTLSPLDNLTFWDRKATAAHVASGEVRTLFSRLKGFQCAQNGTPAAGRCATGAAGARARVRVILIGHSFGGLILYSAVSGLLLDGMADDLDGQQPDGPVQRFGDMVVLLNPAFEATRYTPLHRLATQRSYDRYQAPVFVSVTSTADWATGKAFPAGRFFNTMFERTASAEEQQANNNTIGHMPSYVTHRLSADDGAPASCLHWQRLRDIARETPAGAARQARLAEALGAEKTNAAAFFASGRKLPDHWVRPLCGGMRLEHLQFDANSPVWNVQTDGRVMAGHDDIYNELLLDFMRQLYHDSILYRADGP